MTVAVLPEVVGRESELRLLRKLGKGPVAVLLAGAAGMDKTKL